jgi:hypothetical protein
MPRARPPAVACVVEHSFHHRARFRRQAAAREFPTEPDWAGTSPCAPPHDTWSSTLSTTEPVCAARPRLANFRPSLTGRAHRHARRRKGARWSTGRATTERLDRNRPRRVADRQASLPSEAAEPTHLARVADVRALGCSLSEGPRPPRQPGSGRVGQPDQARSPIMILGVGGVAAPPGRTVAALREAPTTGRTRGRPAVVRGARDLVARRTRAPRPRRRCLRSGGLREHDATVPRLGMREGAAALLGFGNRLRTGAVRRRCGERRCAGSSPGQPARARSACR